MQCIDLASGLPHGAYDWVIMRAHYGKERLVSAVAGVCGASVVGDRFG